MVENILSKPELFWFFIGLVLLLLELFTPGFVIFFFGVGAWVTALICLIANPGVNLQAVIFAVTSVLSMVVLRKMIQKKFFYKREAESDALEDEFTGKEGVALTEIAPGMNGKVEFKGTTWNGESEVPISKGQKVIILKKDSFKLIIKPKNS
jgi:membrane protein implicated in regulation of membrane protease activity